MCWGVTGDGVGGCWGGNDDSVYLGEAAGVGLSMYVYVRGGE